MLCGETYALTFQSRRVEWVTYLPKKSEIVPEIMRESATDHLPMNSWRRNSKSSCFSVDGGKMRTDMVKGSAAICETTFCHFVGRHLVLLCPKIPVMK